jgi:PAS domain-containing protein
VTTIALQALEHLLDSVICVQRDGTVTFLNQAACDMLQLSPTRVLNKKRIDSILSIDGIPYDLTQMHSDAL